MTKLKQIGFLISLSAASILSGAAAEGQTQTITINTMTVNNGNKVSTAGGTVPVTLSVTAAYINNDTAVTLEFQALNQTTTIGTNPQNTTFSNTVTVQNNSISSTNFNINIPQGSIMGGDTIKITCKISTTVTPIVASPTKTENVSN